MKRVSVLDDDAGHAVGWDPDGATTLFTIFEPANGFLHESFVSVEVLDFAATNYFCDTVSQTFNTFQVRCSIAPPNPSELHYVIFNLPLHVISD